MRAVQLFGKGDIRFGAVAAPGDPGPGEALLRIEAAGICGSDIHNFRTGQWLSRMPSIPGHEFCATVTGIGPGTEHLAVGDRVVADSRFWCGACEACRYGRLHLCQSLGFVGEVCDGGFAEQAVLPSRLLLKVGHTLPAAVAATAEPLAVALHAVKRLGPAKEQTVLVTGCGMIGALAALILSRLGIPDLRIADRNRRRAELVARQTGARIVELDQAAFSGVGGVIEATGSTSVLDTVLRHMPGSGRIALVGIFHGGLEIDPNLLVERELALLGCHAFSTELPEAAAALQDLAGGISTFLGEPIRLEDVPDFYRRIAAGAVDSPKTIVRP